MDGLTLPLVVLTSAKAGLERLSPYTAAACILSANAPDIDVVSGFFGGRWVLLQHHRGITHSIVGTLVLGILIPSILFGVERALAGWRKQLPKIRYRGLLVASLIAAATHPLMDWTNNYGVRPFLPWDGKWFYGDLVFIVDPYLILVLGGGAFLLTSDRRWKVVIWSLVALIFTIIILRVSPQRSAGVHGLNVARTIWLSGVAVGFFGRFIGLEKSVGKPLPRGAASFGMGCSGAPSWGPPIAYHKAGDRGDALSPPQN